MNCLESNKKSRYYPAFSQLNNEKLSLSKKLEAKSTYKPSSVPPCGGDDHLSRTAVTDGL